MPIPGGSLGTGSLAGNLGQRIHYRTAAITHGNRDVGFNRRSCLRWMVADPTVGLYGFGVMPLMANACVAGGVQPATAIVTGAVAVVNATPLVVVPCYDQRIIAIGQHIAVIVFFRSRSGCKCPRAGPE